MGATDKRMPVSIESTHDGLGLRKQMEFDQAWLSFSFVVVVIRARAPGSQGCLASGSNGSGSVEARALVWRQVGRMAFLVSSLFSR